MRHGSLQNLMSANVRSDVPEAGMGATILMWTDRHAATVVEVSPSGNRIGVRRDHARRVDKLGLTDSGQAYEFTPDPDAEIQTFTRRKDGRWVREGEPMRKGTVLVVGRRDEYYDFSF